ncbi:MAG: radical SAM protein, partial [Deltaproteobacteria bacterium]|nr:radical SAM protein [Deltaproteobacteria bacterium]
MSSKLIAKAKKLLAQETRTWPSGQPSFPNGFGEKLSIALAYPHRYYTAMSNLGFQTVHRLFNEQPNTVCQRVFLPDPEDVAEYRRTETPLFSLESQQPVRSFDILAFSISYENDYPHLLQMMELARIPLRNQERTGADPLVMAGGATVLMNPEPLADFVDFFVIGEAEV